MITEDYVSFEIAKLLKEKGFNEICFALYNPSEELIRCGVMLNNTQVGRVEGSYSAPTLQMTMKWLRKVHGLFIRVTEDITGSVFEWSIYQKNYGCKISTYVEDSYEKACETAIKYSIINLI